jgi:ssDNA-binding Zn-finger/Zn-ribbon topoisomerase 1
MPCSRSYFTGIATPQRLCFVLLGQGGNFKTSFVQLLRLLLGALYVPACRRHRHEAIRRRQAAPRSGEPVRRVRRRQRRPRRQFAGGAGCASCWATAASLFAARTHQDQR